MTKSSPVGRVTGISLRKHLGIVKLNIDFPFDFVFVVDFDSLEDEFVPLEVEDDVPEFVDELVLLLVDVCVPLEVEDVVPVEVDVDVLVFVDDDVLEDVELCVPLLVEELVPEFVDDCVPLLVEL